MSPRATTNATRHRRRAVPHARIQLDPLDPDQALALVNALESIIRAIWHAHGDAMADRHARLIGDQPRPFHARWLGTPTDEDLPF
jgi:hypothetical protein